MSSNVRNDNRPASGAVCRDLPVTAMSDDQFFEHLTRLHARHNAMDTEALLRLFTDADVEPSLLSVDDASAFSRLHCQLPHKVD